MFLDTEAGEAIHSLIRATVGTATGDYALGGSADATGDPAASTDIGGFPATGTESYDNTDTVSGTYLGASGTYTCVLDAGCMAAAAGAAGTDLTAGWTFTPNAGAMLQQEDSAYLQFGWWVRMDKDGPTHAGAFYSSSATELAAVTETVINTGALVGEATYTGKAAGKFAISDPLRPANDDAGHFTADAMLTADFKDASTDNTNQSTLSGTIDNFRLNDGSENPGWSVALQETMFVDADDKFMTAATPDDDQTVWSIGDGSGAASGAWEAQLYDEAADDGSNVPTTVIGSFSSGIGTTHSMVGAFGANKDE